MRAFVYDRYGSPAVLRVAEVPVTSPGPHQVLVEVAARSPARPDIGTTCGMLVVEPGPTYFEPLAEACLAGDVKVHIDRTFGLNDVPEALAYVGEGHALGKVVVALG